MTIIDYALPSSRFFWGRARWATVQVRHKMRIENRESRWISPIDQVVVKGRKEKETQTKESLSYEIQNDLLCHVQKLMRFRTPVQSRHVPLRSKPTVVEVNTTRSIIISVEQEYKWMVTVRRRECSGR